VVEAAVGVEEAAVTRGYWSVVEATVEGEDDATSTPGAGGVAVGSTRMVRVEVAARPVGSVAT